MYRSTLRRVMSVLVSCSILVQTSAPGSAALSRELSTPVSAQTTDVTLPPSPLVEYAHQLVAAQLAHPDPAPAPAGELLPPGTVSTPASTTSIYQVFLPLVASRASSSTEIALYPDTWMAATANWEQQILDQAMVRYPATWQATALTTRNDSSELSVTNSSQQIEVVQERKDTTSHPGLGEYVRAGYQVRDVTVKGLRAWQITPTGGTDLCIKVIVDVVDHWMTFQQKSLAGSTECNDQSTFSLVISSLQIFATDESADDTSLVPLPVTQPAPLQVTAINYNRQATVIYQQTYSPPGCTSGLCSNDDGYRVPNNRDGAHYAAHVLQSGGFPIHYLAGQDNYASQVINITAQRTYLDNLIPQGLIGKVTDPAKMKPGDYIHMTDGYLGGTCGQAATVIWMDGGVVPWVTAHFNSQDYGPTRYDLVHCPLGGGWEFWHVQDPASPQLNSGLSLNPSTQVTGSLITASFNVHNYGDVPINLQLRVTTNGGGDFTTTSCTLNGSGDCPYSQSRSFSQVGTYNNTCAQMNRGNGWESFPPDSGGCNTLNIVEPANVRLTTPLVISPTVLPSGGGTVRAQFSVQNTGGTATTERFRAKVYSGTVTFDETSDVPLPVSWPYNYDVTKAFAVTSIYTVTAEHLLNSTWKPLIGAGGTYFRVEAPPPPMPAINKGNPPPTGSTGDPVNTSTGNYYYDFTDLSDPTPGLTLEATRWYNALDANQVIGPFGYGTSWTYNMTVTWRADKTAVVRMADGHLAYFIGDIFPNDPTNLAGTYHGQYNDQSTLARAADGTAILTEPDQTAYHFDAVGKLVRASDTFPSKIDVIYSGSRPVQLVHSAGVTYTIGYAGSYIASIASSTGRVVTYTYSPAGDLIGITRPDGSTYVYDYDANHRVIEARDPNGHAYLQNVYDAQGRVIRQYDQSGSESTFTYGPVITSTRTFVDAVGNTITHTYDSEYRIAAEIDSLGHVITYTYNSQNKVTARRDKNGAIWKYTYDDRGNMLTETDPLNSTWTYTYDANNNRLSQTDPLGKKWQYQYDTDNRLIRSIDPLGYQHQFAYNAQGHLVWEQDEASAQTTYEYDALGRRTATIDALGNATRMAYDAFGNQTVYTDAKGSVAYFFYDDLNRLVKSIDPVGRTITFTYDALGNLLVESDGLGHLKHYTYDAHDRIIAETDFNGNVTQYGYDALGRKTIITDALGYTSIYTYNAVGSLIARQDKDGAVTRMEYDPSGRLLREIDPLGRMSEYVYDMAGRQIETRRPCAVCAGGVAVSRQTYDAAGRVLTETEPRGATMRYQYDALGRTAVVTDTYGFTKTTTYDPSGRVIQEVNALGAVSRSGYDLLGHVVTTTNALGYQSFSAYDAVGRQVQAVNARGYTTTSVYDGNDRLVSTADALGGMTLNEYDMADRLVAATDVLSRTTRYQYDANGNQIATINPRGYTSTVEYDALNRAVRATDALGTSTLTAYDKMGHVISTTDALGNVRTTTYDAAGRKIAERSPLGYTTVYTYDAANNLVARQEPTGAVWHFEYDANGNRLRQIDPLGQVTNTEYDLLNRPIKETDPLGAVTRSQYDALGQLVMRTDPRGATTRHVYDALGREIQQINPLGYTRVITYDAQGNRVADQDERGFVSTAVFDALDRTIGQADALGHMRYTLYDAAGQVTADIDYNANVTQNAYDAAGNAIQVTDALSHTTTTTFDALNRAATVTDPLGRTRTTTYDAMGRVLSESTPLGHTTVYAYNAEGWRTQRADALGHLWTTAFDAAGRSIAEADPLNHTTTTTYDALGRVSARTDALNRTTAYTYDPAGRLLSVIAPNGTTQRYTYDPTGNILTEVDGNGHITRYEYDRGGQQTHKTDALGRSWITRYDGGGNPIETATPAGHAITQTFDALNRLSNRFEDSVLNAAYAYDANGNRAVMTDTLGATTYVYDARNRLIASTDYANRTAQWMYDAAGQRVSLTYPDGTVAGFAYDADGNQSAVTAPEGGVTLYAHDALGHTTVETQANGIVVTSAYDVAGNLIDLTQRDTHGVIFARQQFTLDAAYRRTQIAQQLPQGTVTTAYTYDALDRLTDSVASDGRVTHYAFDNAGNRLLQWGATPTSTYYLTYTYDAGNQLALVAGNLISNTTYLYDTNGNRISVESNTERQQLTYDANGRLLTAQVYVNVAGLWLPKNNVFERYTYDGANRRVRKDTVSDAQTVSLQRNYRYDDVSQWDVLKTYDVTTSIQESRYLYDQSLHKLGYWQGSQAGYFQNDGLGSVLGATNISGIVPSTMMRYGDYGEQLSSDTALPTDDAFTGYEQDTYTNLYYARNRYYDTTTGTFLTPDPFPANRQDVGDLHRYLYVQANPANSIDPLGLFNWNTGQIESGDTLSKIAQEGGTTVNAIMAVNPQIADRDKIYAGQYLRMPECSTAKCKALRAAQIANDVGTLSSSCGQKTTTRVSEDNKKSLVDVAASNQVRSQCCGFDVTTWLMNRMQENARSPDVQNIEKSQWMLDYPILRKLYVAQLLVVLGGHARKDGDWDLKKYLDFSIDTAAICPSSVACKQTITICGKCFDYGIPGNLHYGYLGKKMGFPDDKIISEFANLFNLLDHGYPDEDREQLAIHVGFDLVSPWSLCSVLPRYTSGLQKPGRNSTIDPRPCTPCKLRL